MTDTAAPRRTVRIAEDDPALGRLSPRERQIAARLVSGSSFEAVASELDITPATVRSTMYRVYRKFDVKGLPALVDALAGECPSVLESNIDMRGISENDSAPEHHESARIDGRTPTLISLSIFLACWATSGVPAALWAPYASPSNPLLSLLYALLLALPGCSLGYTLVLSGLLKVSPIVVVASVIAAGIVSIAGNDVSTTLLPFLALLLSMLLAGACPARMRPCGLSGIRIASTTCGPSAFWLGFGGLGALSIRPLVHLSDGILLGCFVMAATCLVSLFFLRGAVHGPLRVVFGFVLTLFLITDFGGPLFFGVHTLCLIYVMTFILPVFGEAEAECNVATFLFGGLVGVLSCVTLRSLAEGFFDVSLLGSLLGENGVFACYLAFGLLFSWNLVTVTYLARCQLILESFGREPLAQDLDRKIRGYFISRGLNDRQLDVAMGLIAGESLRQTSVRINYSVGMVKLLRHESYGLLGVHGALGVIKLAKALESE